MPVGDFQIMDRRKQMAMWAHIKGKKVKIGSNLTINTGRKDRRVKLMERHEGNSSQICVLRKGKMMLVPKSSVIKIG